MSVEKRDELQELPMSSLPDKMTDYSQHGLNVEMDAHEEAAVNALIRPDDIYSPEGIYWADLPLFERIRYVSSYDSKEARRELGLIGRMLKADPLSPIGYYFKNMVLPGAGLGLEGYNISVYSVTSKELRLTADSYVLFSIGNLKPLFEATFPDCWDDETVCNANWVDAIDYLEVIGIIVGQLLVGVLGDWIGRRFGLIQDAVVMTLGLVMLTAAWGLTMNGWVICYAWSLFIYGIGVGGEYPMTATSGMENAIGSGKVSTKEDRLHRGRKVTSAFLMQGWGQFLNQAILIILLLIFHSGGNPPYTALSTQWTYRVSFGIPAVGTMWLVYYRFYHMKAASKQLVASKQKESVTGYDSESLKLILNHFGFRLLATAGGWFCNDVFFYGNKLFQDEFISALAPSASAEVMTSWLWNLVNVGVSLTGYYLASFLIDNKMYGRKWMQIIGFALDFILFMIPAWNYKYYTSAGIRSFQALYFLSSFFNQFGPNSVTFLVAAEVFPTPIRATAHGISAAVGKLGALLASILYNYVTTEQKFMILPWFGLGGMVLTVLFLPDTTGLDLKEQERRWTYIRQGREHEYHGVAVHPRHLSLWERVRGKGKYYDPHLDYKQKIEDARAEWEAAMARRACEQDGDGIDSDDTLLDGHLHSYFYRTSPKSGGLENDNAVKAESVVLPPASQDGGGK
ncbi:MFS phosphate transporter [Aspergillus sclerotialis]|uniref:MFS phosphate transporter n=1 Tax=Aspergillus sclerotialis TaxID=2070753 RepID=A0A3A2Z614_9EURO|nr:MFS phosphate transporter [Aspergillus sclerotialis]